MALLRNGYFLIGIALLAAFVATRFLEGSFFNGIGVGFGLVGLLGIAAAIGTRRATNDEAS